MITTAIIPATFDKEDHRKNLDRTFWHTTGQFSVPNGTPTAWWDAKQSEELPINSSTILFHNYKDNGCIYESKLIQVL